MLYAQPMPTPEEFTAAELYDPVEHDGTGRIELLHWLIDKGFTIEDMQQALLAGNLEALAGDRQIASSRTLSRAEALDITGLDNDRLEALAMAFGFMPIYPNSATEITFTEAEAEAISIVGALSFMFSDAEAAGLIRVIGSSLGRIAEAAVSVFLADIESPHLAAGGNELELAKKAEEAVGLLDGFSDLFDPVLRRHLLQATVRIREATIDRMERFGYRYAVGFVDLVGFTALSGDMDAPDLAAFIRDFEGRAQDQVVATGGRVVKMIGDEVMFVSTDPSAACRAATALMSGLDDVDGLTVAPRGGIAYGEVLLRGGDYYGSVVNLASRLADQAVPMELLVTSEVVASASGFDFEPAGRRMLKGFPEPVVAHSLICER